MLSPPLCQGMFHSKTKISPSKFSTPTFQVGMYNYR